LTAYANYNEGNRAPTPIELTCADPQAPCKLPNQFLADPPLAQVVSKTFELGARGTWNGIDGSLAIYRTNLDNDIQFIASGQGAANAGYFQNVGPTRRQGVELMLATRAGPFTLDFRYNHIDATFRSTFAALSPNNSSADANGAIIVQPGNRIPGIPADSAKLRIEYEAGPLALGASLITAGPQYAHGDENNQDTNGRVPGYFVVNLDGQYAATRDLGVFFEVVNLFNTEYSNIGLLGANAFTGPDRTFGPALGIAAVPEQFRGLGVPRGIFVGVRWRFDALLSPR
jgi:iron complex outermembrane receptor protein